ncbi:hypothetical protein OXPF_25940 [Oxobacter pfennigii]|uniref:DUF1638 domain-containing protein n=1 Tax=Oxobacter pfennigii TaxID=36849 RepID=A0A0P8WZ42_9CLOT|nr:DUF1638 domain-containing protein [Oxobacter pfennigii]KPU43734.1 hypothetical protein OXPF_25940 [Oxobacter pfennigii]
MKTIAVACKTLKSEIIHVIEEMNIDFPVIWIKSGLHNTPEKLSHALQDTLDTIDNVDNILMLYGNCGNSLIGLHHDKARIIIPNVSDCISLFLGGDKIKKQWDEKAVSYYLTKGYLESESNIWTDYTYCLNKYGEKRAKRVMEAMLKSYEKLRIIETGAYELQEILESTKQIASTLDLEHEVIKGSINILYKALKEEWDDDFIIVDPGVQIDYKHFGVMQA